MQIYSNIQLSTQISILFILKNPEFVTLYQFQVI